MANFIQEVEVKEENAPVDVFEEYFENEIVPLVNHDNMIKRRYRGRFWAFFWSVSFFVCVNLLLSLFGAIMHQRTFNWEPIAFFSVCAYLVVFYPIIAYYRQPRTDIFDVFLKFYGSWKHEQNKEVKLVHSVIIPKHDFVSSSHRIENMYHDVKIEMRDTVYTSKFGPKILRMHRTVSRGVIVYMTFPQPFKESICLFEKGGFMRKNKWNNMTNKAGIIEIPAANYFSIFCENDKYLRALLRSNFFESLLDMKDVFNARHIYAEIEDDHIRIYFENSSLYVDNYKFWSRDLDKEKFRQLHNEFIYTYMFADIISLLVQDI